MLFFLPLLLFAPSAHAWGAVGHEIVATIAQMHLHPTAFDKICTILNMPESTCHLAPIAAWADRVRFSKRWSAPMHYVGAFDDHPCRSCLFPGERGWEGRERINVLGAISNYTSILKDEDRNMEDKNEALKFLVHYLGDMHMPLHLTGRARGGNSIKVTFDGRVTNLHSVWDSLIISKSLRTIPLNYTRPLPTPVSDTIERHLRDTIYDPYIRRLIWEGLWGRWLNEATKWSTCPSISSPTLLERVLQYTPFSIWFNLATNTNQGNEWDTEELCPYYWAKPIHEFNCDIIWPKEIDEPPYNQNVMDEEDHHHDHFVSAEEEMSLLSTLPLAPHKGKYFELDTPAYTGVIHDTFMVEKLLAQGGLRLAAILNSLYADS